ncbi:hypothetical protein LTR56_025963 [Elasticomyces elasticus]|nr:hypothetical protein LTR56_025963 [Elasticomyces elasticus]KAK3618391.1 hypothetical protein LTR22_026396 [Elasticomyces elasticus]
MALIASGYSDVSSLNYFTTPPAVGAIFDYKNNPNYTIGQQMNLEWQTNITVGASLWLYQVTSTWEYAAIFKGQYPVPTTYPWTVSNLDFALANGTVFYFHLTNSTDTEDNDPVPGCFSHFFNILEADSRTPGDSSSASTSALTTSTSSPASSTAATSTNAGPSAPTTLSPSASPPNAAPAQQSDSLSSGAKAGIGVGLGLGAAAILVGALIWFIRRKRSALRQKQPSPLFIQQMDRYHDNGAASRRDELPQYEKRRPLAGEEVTHEMPVNGQRHELGGPDVHELGGNDK